MHHARRMATFSVLLLGELASLGVLIRLGSRPPFAIPLDDVALWLRVTDPADAVAALVRVLALAGAAWLVVTTLLYAGARTINGTRAVRAVEWATLPAVRRIVDGALALVAVGALATPAVAATRAPPTIVRDGRAVTTVAPFTPATPAPAETAAPTLAEHEVVVTPGDNLWNLAAARVAIVTARDRAALDDREIAPYWIDVCDANRERARSGDVNLIYAGEVVLLPPVT